MPPHPAPVPLRLLHGHTSPDTAYTVDQTRPGGPPRRRRFWTHTATAGNTLHHTRVVTQTTEPAPDGGEPAWGAPLPGTYHLVAALHLDPDNRVGTWTADTGLLPEQHGLAVLSGIPDQLQDREHRIYTAILAQSRDTSPHTWAEWDAHLAALAHHLRTHDDHPPVPDPGHQHWTDHHGTTWHLPPDHLHTYTGMARLLTRAPTPPA